MSVMRLLMEEGADIEEKNTHGSTALIEACRSGYLECVQLLVEHGANMYAPDGDGKTCLHVALEEEQYSCVGHLLEQDSRDGVVRPTGGLCLLQHFIMTDDAVSISNLKDCEVDLNAFCPVRFLLLLGFF